MAKKQAKIGDSAKQAKGAKKRVAVAKPALETGETILASEPSVDAAPTSAGLVEASAETTPVAERPEAEAETTAEDVSSDTAVATPETSPAPEVIEPLATLATEPVTPATPVKPKRQKAQGPKKLSAIDAAAKVLIEAGTAMNCTEMIEAMATKGYWSSPGGKTPAATLYSAILREISTKGKDSRFTKTGRGSFAAVHA